MLVKLQKLFLILGFFFMILHYIYVRGYSTSVFLKYSLVIGLLFLMVDLIMELTKYIGRKLRTKK